MKKSKGTPIKKSRVTALKKLFETQLTSSPSERLVELLQPARTNLTSTTFNPKAEESSRLGRDICVDQPGKPTETGPRQAGVMAGRLCGDWASQSQQSGP